MKLPKSIEDRRRSIRIEESLPFKIGHEGYEIEATTVNISSTGVMCLVEKDIPMMTQVQFGLSLNDKILKAKGVIVRKERDPESGKFFVAIFFSDIKEKALEALITFIHDRLRKKAGP